ncbi:hypothetical protein QOZ80_3AG0227150 [Eleusine coracana subsp. coracana]|nr:hypothetical protein QOZ80_3AG0227150 [Eleusine coracana subsp. coracana]
MEMLRRNLKRQASRSLSALAAATSPRAAAADQENLHPNLASSPPASPAKTSSAKDRSPRPKQHPTAAAPQTAAAAEDDHAVTPAVDETSVKVVVRVRPPVSLPTDGKDLWFVRKTSPDCVAVGDRAFAVDGVLDDRASQADAFDMVGLPMIESALAGFNTSLVCYGQSGTGKTYTMWGPLAAMVDSASDQTDHGVVPRVFQDLFTRIQSSQESSPDKQISYQCRCSFLEVHNEQINDLLEPSQRDLQIRENAGNGIHVENLTDEYVSTIEDVNQILMKGLSNRKVGTTSMNLKSSRSHVVFTCVIEAWSKGFTSNGFSSSRTSRITFVDLAGPENDELDGAAKHCTKEERHLKKSLSKLGKLVNILSEAPEFEKVDLPYEESRLTHVLKDTLGGNSRVTFLCSISSEHRCRSGTLSTLRFGERAKLMPNKALINEISADDVNGLSDQIRQLKDELVRTKSGDTIARKAGYFRAQTARESLHSLRVSLNRSLILPHIEIDSEEEMEVDEEDVHELCDQINKLHSSSDTFDDFMDAESGDDGTPCSNGTPKTSEEDDQPIIYANESPLQDNQKEAPDHTDANESMAKVNSAIPEDERTVLCSSCKKPVNTNENQTESAEKQIVVASNVTKSASASLKNVNNSEAIGSKRETELEALCKEQAAKIKELSILIDQLREGSKDSPDSNGVTTVEGRSSEEKISEQCGDNKMTANEREALLNEIESLKEQLNHQTNVSTNGSLLDQIRNGETDQEYELDKERQRWMESESKWISLTEELRVDLESNRMHAEKTEMELCNEKKCTAELDDALQRAMYGHARMVEHYVELQELYNDLLEKHRRVMDAISEVKRAAAKAGRKGCGTAFAAALAAELSTFMLPENCW